MQDKSKQKKIRVCSSRSCDVFGAKGVMKAIEEETGLKPGQQDQNYDVDWCGCRGKCSKSPNVEVDEEILITDANPHTIMEKVEKGEGESYIGMDIDLDEILTEDGLDRLDS